MEFSGGWMLARGPRVTSRARPLRYSGAPQAATGGVPSKCAYSGERVSRKKVQTHSISYKFLNENFQFLLSSKNSFSIVDTISMQ